MDRLVRRAQARDMNAEIPGAAARTNLALRFQIRLGIFKFNQNNLELFNDRYADHGAVPSLADPKGPWRSNAVPAVRP